MIRIAFFALFTAFYAFLFCGCEKLQTLRTMLRIPAGRESPPKNENSLLSGDFLIRPKHSPLWFEFVEGGVKQISGPENASLYDWTPWLFVPSVIAFMPNGSGIVMVVNRIGFYELRNENSAADGQDDPVIAVLSAKNAEVFADKTVSTPFYFENRPAAMLENIDLEAKKNPVRSRTRMRMQKSRAWGFVSGKKQAIPLDIPAFDAVLSAAPDGISWEIKHFFVDAARSFYFFVAESGETAPVLHFFRADSPELSENIEELPPAAFYAASRPAAREAAPPALKRSLELAALDNGIEGGKPLIATVFSPRFGGAARFFVRTGGAEDKGGGSSGNADILTGCYTETPHALLCSSDGSLYEYPETGVPRRLPALPEGFVWTGAAALNGIIAASWEERASWQTGAAGIAFIVY